MISTPANPPCQHCGAPRNDHHDRGARLFLCPGVLREVGNFRRRAEDLPGEGIAPHPEIPLGRYRHSKSGKEYIVTGGAYLATGNGDAVLVVYRPANGEPSAFLRTIHDFLASAMLDDGRLLPRFVPLTDVTESRP